MISLDTEATGLDLYHGAKPFMVSICNEEMQNTCWEWAVNPCTRQPQVPPGDLEEIQEVIEEADLIVLQNPKFDYVGLQTIFCGSLRWDWGKVRDTLLAGHLLASNQPHDLTSMALIYAEENIQPFEDDLEEAVKECRRTVKADKTGRYKGWKIAEKGIESMPSAKEKVWKYDSWLPRRLALSMKLKKDHPWFSVCSQYCNADTASTLLVYREQERLLKERGLWEIYLERLKILPIVVAMENHGVTTSANRLKYLYGKFTKESREEAEGCLRIAKEYGFDLTLPKSGNNKSLKTFIFEHLELPPLDLSEKTGDPTLNKENLQHYEATLEEGSKEHRFVCLLQSKRKRDTALNYMDGYRRFWLPTGKAGWYLLHPSLNPTGTDTLRWSSSNPNEQNISKQEGFSLRYCFGPMPGREWVSIDYSNLELRIPAYEAGEKEMIYLFEHPDDPPYYGSYHVRVFAEIHPDKFRRYGYECRDKFKSTWYQWTKNGNFAVQYGSVEQSGTADRAYHVPGAFRKVKQLFKRIHGPGGLNERMINHAQEFGYVTTIPDRSVDPRHGYPIYCTRSRWGKILPTVPLNYHVQSTACWAIMKAMIRCFDYLKTVPDVYLVMQIHDELVFDLPLRGKNNGKIVGNLMRLMEKSGEDFGIPLPVEPEYHPNHWGEKQEFPYAITR